MCSLFFCIANEKIYINSIAPESLKIIGLADDDCYKVYKKRKESPLCSSDDLKDIISDVPFKKLKQCNNIIY